MMEPFGVQEIKKKSYKKYIITTLVIALVIALLWLYFSCLFVRKTFGTKTIELGGSLSNNVEDYIAGSDWLIERATLDFTELDTSKTGEYTVRCVSWIYHYSYKIKVKDTVAPTIKLKDEDVYVAVDDRVGIFQNRLAAVGENDFGFGSAFAYKVTVILYIIDTRELVGVDSEQGAVFLFVQNVRIGIDSGGVKFVEAYQLVAHFIGGVTEHKNYFFAALCNSAQADCKAVS